MLLGAVLFVALASTRCWCLSQEEQDSTWSPLTVARCRATCLRAFVPNSIKDSSCQKQPDCNMCWENCQLLQSDWSVWGAVCSEKAVCLAGCRTACRFFSGERAAGVVRQPVTQTRAFQLLVVDTQRASWPCRPPNGASRPLVYVLMWRPAGADKWTQVAQTASCSWQLPPGAGTARVLVVASGGLLTVYTPDPAASSRTQPVAVVSDIVRGGSQTAVADDQPHSQWSVRVSSLLHQGVLVIAELSWRPPAPDLEAVNHRGGTALYLVTWEVDGGGITGNLYTDNTCVTLSLWPDTVFHIRVELVSHSSTVSRSPPLQVDTSGSPSSAEPARGRPSHAPATPATALLLSAGLVLAVAASLVVAIAMRRRRPTQDDRWSLVGHEHDSKVESLHSTYEETGRQFEDPSEIKDQQHQSFLP